MGNRMTVARPYIIDDYSTTDDDEDEDEDYFSYETAYDTEGGVDQNMDEEDNGRGDTTNVGQEVMVNSQVVSSLVKEVETLLSFLDRKDYEGAQQAARMLKQGGTVDRGKGLTRGDRIDESQPLLSKRETNSNELSRHHQRDSTDAISRNGLGGEEAAPLLSFTCATKQDDDNDDDDDTWITRKRMVLQQLDRDLTSFEENESLVVANRESEEEIKPRRKRKSSLPRLKRDAIVRSDDSSGGGGGGSKGTTRASSRSQSRSRESSLNRPTASSRLPRSPGSGIPRFCYKVPTGDGGSNGGGGKRGSSPSKSTSLSTRTDNGGSGGRKSMEEAITKCVAGYTSQAPHDAHTNIRSNPISYSRSGHYNSDKDGTSVEAWDVNISDFTGRAKRNKKRSGIPSLWTQNKSPHSPPSPSSPFSSHSPSHSFSSTNTCDSLNIPTSRDSHVKSTINIIKVNASTQTVENSHNLESDLAKSNVSGNTVKWDMNPRKVCDLRRWNCISRPQYRTSCGISSVVSCWNYLFSTLGHGHLHPLSQEDAMTLLGFEAPFDEIKFGPTTGNLTLMRWFRQLNDYFKVTGRCYILYKPKGRNRTCGMTSEMALERLKAGLKDKHTAFIYHCHNHYFCPIGYEETPSFAADAYSDKISDEAIEKSWIMIGDTSRKYGTFHCKSWDDIDLDFNCENPQYFNIRQSWNGVMTRENRKAGSKVGGNLHCIICFQAPQLTQNNHNLLNLLDEPGGLLLQKPFCLHPPPPPSSSPNSWLDGDGGSRDCNNIMKDTDAEVLNFNLNKATSENQLYSFDYGVEKRDEEYEKEEIISCSSENDNDYNDNNESYDNKDDEENDKVNEDDDNANDENDKVNEDDNNANDIENDDNDCDADSLS